MGTHKETHARNHMLAAIHDTKMSCISCQFGEVPTKEQYKGWCQKRTTDPMPTKPNANETYCELWQLTKARL